MLRPHLVRWHEKWSEKGLVIIEVEDGRIDPLSAVEDHVKKENLPYLVLHDGDGEVTERYGVMAYPTTYLVDREGKVVWEGHPGISSLEKAIEAALGG